MSGRISPINAVASDSSSRAAIDGGAATGLSCPVEEKCTACSVAALFGVNKTSVNTWGKNRNLREPAGRNDEPWAGGGPFHSTFKNLSKNNDLQACLAVDKVAVLMLSR
jgi:hypothetical protein